MENSELRRRTRQQLGGDLFGKTWLMMLLAFVIFEAILSAATGATFGIASLILFGPLQIGYSNVLIKRVRTEKDVDLNDLFCGFTYNFADNLLIGLVSNIFIFLWSMLFVIPGIIKSLSYSMAYYIKLDNPEYDHMECITASRKLMDGNKWKLFCLDLSFIGWYIVGFLCLGVGLLWVYPYHTLAKANFYESIKQNEPQKLFGETKKTENDL